MRGLSLLVAKASAHAGHHEVRDTKSVLSIFCYSPKTKIRDTQLATFGLVKEVKGGYIITGLITKCQGRRNKKMVESLPGWQKALINLEWKAPAPAPRRWGRWELPPDRPFGLILELGDDVVGVDFISLRDEWKWKSQEIASTPGITQQDIADIEQARADLDLLPEVSSE